MKKIISISFFLICIAIAIVYIFWGETFIVNLAAEKTAVEDSETYDEKIDREANDNGLEARLPYGKEFHVIGIGEINNSVFLGGSTLHLSPYFASYNNEEKALYFYNNSNLPSESHDIIVIKEVYSLDSLLQQELLYGTDEVSVRFPAIQQEEDIEQNKVVLNENRLFLDARFEIAVIDQTKINVMFNEQIYSLKEGETKTYDLVNGDVKSKIAVTYFGKWKSSDMKFIVGEE
ncbi:MAG TPA: hypothetical protein VNR38_06220 [Ureibacillus sp.]|nr:hypothetical protein [Ureibacillus sp.]